MAGRSPAGDTRHEGRDHGAQVRLRRILSVGAITLAATVATSSSCALAAVSHGKACKSGALPIAAGVRHECVAIDGIKHDIATKPQAQASQLETMLINYIEASAGHLRKGGPAVQHALGSAEPAAKGVLGRWLSAAQSKAMATVAANSNLTEIPAPAGQVGAGVDGGGSTSIPGPNGHHVTVKLEMRNTGFVDECPDPKGISTGTATSLYRQSFDAPGLPLLGVGAGSGGFRGLGEADRVRRRRCQVEVLRRRHRRRDHRYGGLQGARPQRVHRSERSAHPRRAGPRRPGCARESAGELRGHAGCPTYGRRCGRPVGRGSAGSDRGSHRLRADVCRHRLPERAVPLGHLGEVPEGHVRSVVTAERAGWVRPRRSSVGGRCCRWRADDDADHRRRDSWIG